MRKLDITTVSETYGVAYYNREDDKITFLMSEYLEENEGDLLEEIGDGEFEGSVGELLVNLPREEVIEYYQLTFSEDMKPTLERWAAEYPTDAEDYGFGDLHPMLPETLGQFKQLSDANLYNVAVNFIAEIASVDWGIDFSGFFEYTN